MNRTIARLFMPVLMSAVVGCAGTSGESTSSSSSLASEPAVSSLIQGLGVTPNQAIGGIGSILSLAQLRLTPQEFQQVAATIPSAEEYIDALGGLGVDTDDLRDPLALRAALLDLGMNNAQAFGVLPAVAEFAGKSGGEPVKTLVTKLGV